MHIERFRVRSRRGGIAKPVIIFLVVIGLAIVLQLCMPGDKPDSSTKTCEETELQTAEEYDAPAEPAPVRTPAPATEADKREIADAITSLPNRLGTSEFDELFDPDRFFAELKSHKAIRAFDPYNVKALKQRKEALRGYHRQNWKPFTDICKNLPPYCEVVRVEIDSRRNLAMATVRHYGLQLPSKRLRWSLHYAGQWRIFDCEDLDMGVKVSDSQADYVCVMVDEHYDGIKTLREPPRMVRVTDYTEDKLAKLGTIRRHQSIVSASRAIREHEWKRALSLLDSAYEAAKYTDLLTARHWFMVALGELHFDCADRAMHCIQQAYKAKPDMPGLNLLKAQALNKIGLHDEAIKAARAYIELLGEDAAAVWEIAKATLGKGDKVAALEHFRKAVRLAPYRADMVLDLTLNLPAGAKGELADIIATMKHPSESFGPLAHGLRKADDYEGLQVAVTSFESIMPDSPLRLMYEARLRYHDKQYNKALASLEQALGESPSKKETWHIHYLRMQILYSAGEPLKAYQAHPDSFEAICFVGDKLLEAGNAEMLGTIIQAHKAKAGQDKALRFYRGRLRMLQGKWSEAVVDFYKGRPRLTDHRLFERVRAAGVESAYKAGEWEKYYSKFPDQRTSVSQLAHMMVADKKADALAVLLQRYTNKKDNNRWLWMSWLDLQQGKHAEGARRLIEKREVILHWENDDYDDANARMLADTLVRLLVRNGQADEAVVEAQFCGFPRAIAIAAAVAGNVDALEKSLSAFCKDGGSAKTIADDPDVKTASLTKEVQAVFAKYKQ